MRILLLTNHLQSFHTGHYYLIHELAKTEKIGCYSDFARRRNLLPIDFDEDSLRQVNFRLGSRLFRLSLKFNAKKRVKKIKQAVQEFDPDVVLVVMNDFFYHLNFKDFSFITCPKVYRIEDVHLSHRQQVQWIKKSRFDLVLFTYKWWENKVGKKVGTKTGWLPYSVNTNVFRDYGLPKLYDVVSAGRYSPSIYPLRCLIQETLPHVSGLKFSMPAHPQFKLKRQKLDASKFLIRENYAKFLNQSKMLVFGSSIYNYPVAKYVEGMGSETLVLSQFPKDGKELGFIPDENFVEINGDNFVDKIKWYLEHDEERQRIVDCARETVLRDHSTEIRAKQLTDFLHEL